MLTIVLPSGCTESAGFVLVHSDSRDVVGTIELSRATYRNGDYDGLVPINALVATELSTSSDWPETGFWEGSKDDEDTGHSFLRRDVS